MASNRTNKIKKAIFTKPYSFYFFFFFFLFIILNLFINKVYITYQVLLDNIRLGIPFVFFSILVAGLVALNVNLVIIKLKELAPIDNKFDKKAGGIASLGVFGGLLGGACPGCFVGLFPAFLGLFGISASLSVLPFYGIELQVVSVILLIISTYYLTKEVVCKVE